VLDYDPPPAAPVLESLPVLLFRYNSDETVQVPSRADGTEDHVLRAIAPKALRAVERLKAHSQDSSMDSLAARFLKNSSENFAIRAVWGGWSTNTGHEMSVDKAIHFLFNVLYGGGHLAAWASSSFPTTIERWLWRGSAMNLCAVPLWGLLWILWWKAVGSQRRSLYLFRNGDLDIIAAPFFFAILMAYTLARCYFIIECLASLRLLPSGAYDTVNWTAFLPHVS
jgi:hypothetical protein